MPAAIYRLRLTDGSVRLARGDSVSGPSRLLRPSLTIGQLLGGAGHEVQVEATALDAGEPVPPGTRVLAPVDAQEVWAAGVTYRRSRDARMGESRTAGSVYDRVYEASRPELFFKAVGWRVRGPGEQIAVRSDSTWDVPEPELTLVIAASGAIAGYAVGNDVSSRSIEGENPLYLPQAKIYDGACAIGPCIVPISQVAPPFAIRLAISRGGRTVSMGEASTAQMHRSFEELVAFLFRAASFPAGVMLMTGTGIVPDDGVSIAAGDRVEVTIDGLGVLSNDVVLTGDEDRTPSDARRTSGVVGRDLR